MFNSSILDVAIGMIFVYLLLSLICSAANELIELLLKKRAIDLERGIREMLVPGSASGAGDVVRDLYNHPLVNSLFGGHYEDTRIAHWSRYIWRTHLPTYIPSRSFALALMDLVLPNRPATVAAAAPAPVQPSGAAGASPPELKPDTLLHSPPSPVTPGNPLENLRNEIASTALLNAAPQARRALLGLIDAAGTDAARARQNIEDWYNASMDRVSGWYKRRAQIFLFIIGFLIAAALNADSIIVAKRLSTDKSVRDSVVAAAEEYAKAHATSSPSPSPSPSPSSTTAGNEKSITSAPARTAVSPASSPKPSPSPAAAGSAAPASSVAAKSVPPAEGKPSPGAEQQASPSTTSSADACWEKTCKGKEASLECKQKQSACRIESCWADACKQGDETAQCRLKKSQCALASLDLPIGWTDSTDARLQWPGWHWKQRGGWWWQLYWHGLGWLLTALAISLGAPFWFDLLNKFIVVRSTVKPKEKSPDEPSKD